ncbi:ATP-grasp domain-containing protein [Noviherbaspirillum cavernae]|uniref:ATP-grasp domain-containing protein n=1 Tax=Noviherbaspirillum cavernae TaxID=2320862 RepID=A0A418X2N4_9BURK|nr:RimK family protein [Noviherbaspirillum cavernae]RJG06704.1 ATP-grasp domain-containing protein [Noviherbaspirillum cavernae]
MNILFVVSHAQDWAFDIPGVTVVPAKTYLMDPAYGECRSTKVFNLCRSYRHQNLGYYVSLLAEARGHAPLPDVEAIKNLQADELVQDTGDRLAQLIDCSFAQQDADAAKLTICFGRDIAQQHDPLCEQLFRLLRVPILHAHFERAGDRWHLCSMYAGNVGDVPPQHHAFVARAAIDYLKEEKIRTDKPAAERPALAILLDPQRPESPSNPEAIRKFCEAAGVLGMSAHMIAPDDARRLPEFDALFIRDTTDINHYTYRLARQAADAGMVVIDDPDSILRCTNKIYLTELLMRHHIPIPKTMIVHRDNVDQIVLALGLPCILKQPDGAFSLGVAKVESEQELLVKVADLLQESELVLAQEYLPTEYDWRVAVLDHRPLFVCKYYMVPGHWQIIKHEHHRMSEGKTEALSVGEAPDEVVKLAVQAANLIGDGFYGVDLKQVGSQCCVIEINDNPNVDAGNEDGVLGDALYREVMGVFRKRIDARKGSTAS